LDLPVPGAVVVVVAMGVADPATREAAGSSVVLSAIGVAVAVATKGGVGGAAMGVGDEATSGGVEEAAMGVGDPATFRPLVVPVDVAGEASIVLFRLVEAGGVAGAASAGAAVIPSVTAADVPDVGAPSAPAEGEPEAGSDADDVTVPPPSVPTKAPPPP
jgi:hypothetical protein